MTRWCHHLRLTWIALAATVVMLSMSGEAKAARSCCSSRPAIKCGDCCGPVEKSASKIQQPDAADAAKAGLVLPDRSCECRPDEPAPAAPKPESRPSQARPDRALESDFASSFGDRTAITFAPLPPRPVGSPKTPLYLRTSRLLI